MVGHQTGVVQAQVEPTPVAPEQSDEGMPVLIIGEDEFAVLAAVHERDAGIASRLVARNARRGIVVASPLFRPPGPKPS
jgi:hypothetical protein